MLTQVRFLSSGPDQTKEIGFSLGKLLKSGSVVGLYGEMGSGKTTMTKGIASALGINERDIASASFTIIAEYDTNPPFYHIDLYRIEKAIELDEVGLNEYISSEGISIIEWAEKADGDIPENSIRVYLKTIDSTTREIRIEGVDEKNWNNL